MTNKIYTVITFAPVQGFIEKSRKLRDLYGSSYLLSYLSWVICSAAQKHGCEVVSPALPNITQGMPNQIIIQGDFPEENAKSALLIAWKCVTETCRQWVEDNVTGDYKAWKRSWGLWTKYAWEFFWVQGEIGQSISDVREKLNEKKRWRDWTGINWQGESSTLSGADAIAYPKLGQISDPRNYDYQQEKKDVRVFYEALSEKLGESFIKSVGLKVPDGEMSERSKEYGKSFIDPEEELSVPELIKRLITHNAIADKLTERLKQVFGNNGIVLKNLAQQINQLSDDLNPTRFTDLSRLNKNKRTSKETQQEKFCTGWFQGDGDKAGEYLKSFANTDKEAEEITKFSTEMREWGDYFKQLPKTKSIDNFRVVYAGGDDFLGVFYNKINAADCVKFFSRFKTETWNEGKVKSEEKKKITVSVGFVWAFPDIPQRDVLQHCREAEKSAKNNGRDRIAFRILFNNGNYLEWVCPWWLLEADLLSNYRDREGKQNWTHIYSDIAVLESRHAFGKRVRDTDDESNSSSDDTGIEIAVAMLAGPFWGNVDEVMSDEQNFYVPTPRNYLVKDGKIVDKLSWKREKKVWLNQEGETPTDKYESNTWLAMNQWMEPKEVKKNPWRFLAHLHPRLELDERHTIRNHQEQGSLFLENSVQMKTGTCLVYLSNTKLDPGWYRFGGEGHMVDVRCEPIRSTLHIFLQVPVGNTFALITPGVWGSNRLSKREPVELKKRDETFYEQAEPEKQEKNVWKLEALFTDRPIPFRYRLGGKGETKLMSRGRYAVPAGTVYVLEEPINQPWQDWDVNWFPQEGPSLKRWGCGLALPLPSAVDPFSNLSPHRENA